MARVLIVGCGCRGRALAGALVERGIAARGTTRRPETVAAIEAAGAEAAIADPDRLGTLSALLDGVSAVAWLMAGARETAVHGPRLEAMLDLIVDTHARGFVYEPAAQGAGSDLREQGLVLVRAAAARYAMPIEVIDADPASHAEWLDAAVAAVEAVLTA